MTPEQLDARLRIVEGIFAQMNFSDRMVFQKSLQILDGRNIQLGKTIGTKIGTESTQLLGFLGATAIAQYSDTVHHDDIGSNAPGTTGYIETTLTGGIATNAYSLGDVIRSLKLYGLLK